jgi:predicted enzyme related to lactoylglutathione lyase
MDQSEPPVAGTIGWRDLTVAPHLTDAVRDFYRDVVGWTVHEVQMDDYVDYAMLDATGAPVAGVCHARGVNAGMPPQWILYVHVADLDASLARVEAAGGRVVVPERPLGDARFAVVADPSDAVVGLYQG